MRIVSLVPSQTELLFDLGLGDRIVGVTKFCVHPEHARKTRLVIGGTKKFDIDRIASLKPDLIIGNKEENYEEGIDYLRQRYPVWMSDILTLEDALGMIKSVALLTGTELKGHALVREINESFAGPPAFSNTRAIYLMWYNPWMGAASGTFISHIMERVGLSNVLAHRERYPELVQYEITDLKPDLVLLSSEPFPFKEKHEQEIRHLLPKAKIMQVDGEMFSWYGSRLRMAPAYFNSLAY